jgi:tetratricopeptide (TPR) repeat protein
MGSSLYSLGRYEEALESIDKAIELDPQNTMLWHNRGITLEEMGRKEEANECYNRANEFNSLSFSVWYNRILSMIGL